MRVEIQSYQGYDNACGAKPPDRKFGKNRPKEHAYAQTVEHAEVNKDIMLGKTSEKQGSGGGAAQHATSKDEDASADGMAAKRDTYTGKKQKKGPTPLHEGDKQSVIF